MEDVARLARVSAMTVSRVLRAPDRVAPDTRARVLAAIERVRYVPDLVASGLASHRTRLVALVIPTLNDSIFADTVQGAADVLRGRGYELVLGHTGYSAAAEERLLGALLGRRPDGLIVTGVDHLSRTRRRLVEARVPIVETWDLTPRPLDSVVGFSNRAAGHAMTCHLIERGYRRIAWLGSRDRRARERLAGYGAALRERLGPSAKPLAPRPEQPPGLHTGGLALERLLGAHPEVDAVFFSSDALAAGGWLACHRNGWSVPGRVAIAGLGDLDIGRELAPPLTTVRVPRYEIGRRAAEVLLDRIEGRSAAGVVVDVGFEIVHRGTT
jgi:LacI family gluconate utilization system Gnt-I transcriptional repressor